MAENCICNILFAISSQNLTFYFAQYLWGKTSTENHQNQASTILKLLQSAQK